jgi:glycosyltransferase involved in cell wall biosynthesis
MISVLILTFNEELNLPACLAGLKWCNDLIVFDSFSTDRTVEIAQAAGARVVQRRFDTEKAHRTAAVQLDFKYPWVYNPDADEVTTPELRGEMLRLVADPARQEVAYRVRFKTMFGGRWIKHSSLYPTWVVRLFQPKHLSFERSINLRYIVNGPEGKLNSHFEHYSFNKGIDAWFEKHNRYSAQEALETLKSLDVNKFEWRELLNRNPILRRRALKELSFRVPFRPALRFLYMYFGRLGVLDGLEGLTYCRLLSIYEQMIVLKMKEIRRRKRGLAV